MPDVNLMFTDEENTQRTYSVDELVEGASGIVVATQRDGGGWAYEFQGPSTIDGSDQNACIDAVREFITTG